MWKFKEEVICEISKCFGWKWSSGKYYYAIRIELEAVGDYLNFVSEIVVDTFWIDWQYFEREKFGR
jgi:hypothetical protein